MIFDRLFEQYQPKDRLHFASKWWAWRCKRIIGKPEDLGLDMLCPGVKDTYYYIKNDRHLPASAEETKRVWRPDMNLAQLHREVYAPALSRGSYWVSFSFCAICCVLVWITPGFNKSGAGPLQRTTTVVRMSATQGGTNSLTVDQCKAMKSTKDISLLQACQSLGVDTISLELK